MIGFNPAVEIASLKKEEQKQLLDAMDYAQSTPSLSQAQRMKKLSKEGKLTKEKMEDIMSEIKNGEISRVIFTNEQLHRYFPSSYTPEKMKTRNHGNFKNMGRTVLGTVRRVDYV